MTDVVEKGHYGPYGYLVIPNGLDEEHWRLENGPEADPEYTSIALYAQTDPFAGRPLGEHRADFTSRAYRIICEAAGGNHADWSAYDHGLLDLAREADAILALFAAQPGEAKAVAIRPLEWADSYPDRLCGAYARSPVGNYAVGDIRSYGLGTGRHFDLRLPFGPEWLNRNHRSEFDTPAEAKAAAQADYEARILSCLTTPPDTAALLEKAADILSAFHSAYSDYRFSPENSWEQADASRRLEDAHTAARSALSDIRKARS